MASILITAKLIWLGFLLLVLLLAWTLKFVVRWLIRKGLVAVGTAAMAKQPDSIHLVPQAQGSWQNVPAARALIDPLLGAGFSDAGSYTIAEMPGVIVHFFMEPSDSIYAAVYEHPAAGSWIDVVSRYQDRTGITVTNNTRGAGLEQRPGNPIIRAPELDPLGLVQRLKTERRQAPLVSLAPDQIRQLFETAYAEATAWRKNKGISAEEVAKVALEKKSAVTAPAPAPAAEVPSLYIVRNDAQEGPYTEEQVRAEITAGRLTPDALGWRDGLADWVPLSSILKSSA